MISVASRSGRHDQRANIPADVADEAILWFREQGRFAAVAWNPVLKCAEVQVRFKPGDPRLKLYQEGEIPEDFEVVYLNYRDDAGHLVPHDLRELGASGVRNLLDRANLHSGRGEFRDLQESLYAVEEQNRKHREMIRRAVYDAAYERAHLARRDHLNLPQVSVPAQIHA